MKKTRDNLPLFNLTTAIRKFYSREETQDSFPAIEFESSRFNIFSIISISTKIRLNGWQKVIPKLSNAIWCHI